MESKIEKIVNSYGASLYDIELTKDGDHNIYRVSITKEGGVDLDICAEISNDISPLLDLNPPIGGEYFLEVSSPGIERKLTKPKHFQSAVGERVKLKITGEGKTKGIVKSANEQGVTIDTKEGEKFYEYSQIGTAKTYFDWANQGKK